MVGSRSLPHASWGQVFIVGAICLSLLSRGGVLSYINIDGELPTCMKRPTVLRLTEAQAKVFGVFHPTVKNARRSPLPSLAPSC